MHFASLLSIPDKISGVKWERVCEKGWMPSHLSWYSSIIQQVQMWIFTPLDTFHFPFVHAYASAQLMESVEVAEHFLSKIEDMSHIWITIWKLAATLLCPNLQVTQRIYSAMQISAEEIRGSVQRVCLEAEHEAKNISFQCFKCSFIYQIGHAEVARGWQIITMKMTVYQGTFNMNMKTNWC